MPAQWPTFFVQTVIQQALRRETPILLVDIDPVDQIAPEQEEVVQVAARGGTCELFLLDQVGNERNLHGTGIRSYSVYGYFLDRVARVSMPRIEKNVREEGNDRTGWDGIGVRAIWYAGAIVLPIGRANRPNNPLIDPVAVQRHATAGDRRRALWLVISSCTWLGSILLLSFLDRN